MVSSTEGSPKRRHLSSSTISSEPEDLSRKSPQSNGVGSTVATPPPPVEAKDEAVLGATDAEDPPVASPDPSTDTPPASPQHAGTGDVRKLPCRRCGKLYSHNRSLVRHERFECGVEPQFTCSLCGKRYRRSNLLKQHFRDPGATYAVGAGGTICSPTKGAGALPGSAGRLGFG